ncbi:MAG: DUF2330 domain-containing protein [Gemmatimonadetes bacterium]|nr:DUF2330 domain-containing protein [Gemmatimonadota bacterium]
MTLPRCSAAHAPILAATLALPAAAFGDGMFVWRNEERDVHEPEQKALVRFEDGTEDLVLSVRFEGATEEFGWIVPLPSAPEISSCPIEVFEELSKATQDRQTRRSRRANRMHTTLGSESGVEVLSVETVGAFEATTISSASGESLDDWLREHRFHLPDRAAPVLGRYAEDGWVFVALRVRPEASDAETSGALADGTIHPVQFRFATEEPVFPLEISSLGGHESTVLLYVIAREALVPAAGQPGEWKTQVHSRPRFHWYSLGLYGAAAREAISVLPDPPDGWLLTKSRATLTTAQMRDVFFEPFDPLRALEGSEAAVRREAAVHLGIFPRPGASVALRAALAGAGSKERECLLWALGEIGDDVAEAAVLEEARTASPEERIECLEALGRMGSRRALPLFLESLSGGPLLPGTDLGPRWTAENLQRCAFDHLLQLGDESIVPELRSMAERGNGFEEWRTRFLRPKGPHITYVRGLEDVSFLAVPLLAARGDERARAAMHDALMCEKDVMSPESLTRASRSEQKRGRAGPSNEWILHALRDEHANEAWEALGWTRDLVEDRPDLWDTLLRTAANDASMPDPGRGLLLGLTDSLRADDVEQLLRLWDRVHDLPEDAVKEPERLTASVEGMRVVALALARHDRYTELRRLLDETDPDDWIAQAELIHAMATTNEPAFADVILERVATIWSEVASHPTFLAEMEVSSSPPYYPAFDEEFRVAEVQTFLLRCEQPAVWARVAELIEDPRVAPDVRLWLMRSATPAEQSRPEFLGAARRALARMRMEAGGRSGAPGLVDRIDWHVSYLERVTQRTVGPRSASSP